jgi:hypothetical protein
MAAIFSNMAAIRYSWIENTEDATENLSFDV